jgi:hypothetical protein
MNTKPIQTNPEFIQSINQSATSPRELSSTDQMRYGFLQMMLDHQESGRSLFFLTLTYKPFQNKVYSSQDVDQFFSTFYRHHFLPELLQTRNYHRPKFRPIQPITVAFIDEHKPVATQSRTNPDLLELSSKLHHHAVLAVHPDTLERIQTLVGENTMQTGFSSKIMTTDLRPCDASAVGYASKMLHRYPEYRIFSGIKTK